MRELSNGQTEESTLDTGIKENNTERVSSLTRMVAKSTENGNTAKDSDGWKNEY